MPWRWSSAGASAQASCSSSRQSPRPRSRGGSSGSNPIRARPTSVDDRSQPPGNEVLRKSGPPARKLHRAHFAFMRALAQGLDERASWDRYLRLEGEHADLRTVRRTVAWIRDAFAAAAKRERRPGTARLILLDPERISTPDALPSLGEFALAQGLEDFSE